jgi:hypothetical protein
MREFRHSGAGRNPVVEAADAYTVTGKIAMREFRHSGAGRNPVVEVADA